MSADLPTNPRAQVPDAIVLELVNSREMLSVFLFSLVHDWEVVEDAQQETAAYVCAHWRDFQAGTNFGAWVRTVARNRAREVLRGRQRHASPPGFLFEDALNAIPDQEWDLQAAESARRRNALQRCVESLPKPGRDLIDLHYTRAQPCEAIAGSLGRSIEAVYKSLSRVRAQLRSCIEQRLARDPE